MPLAVMITMPAMQLTILDGTVMNDRPCAVGRFRATTYGAMMLVETTRV
jgi:uncharacterized protein YhhL (DUF1145 family)